MGDEDECDADIPLEKLQLVLDRLAEVGIKRAERLVEKEDVGLDDQAACECGALALAAGQRARAAARRNR